MSSPRGPLGGETPPTGEGRKGPSASVLAGLVALGAIAFLVALATGSAAHAWSAFLVNLLFWSGLAATGPAIAGMFELTEARWAARVRRMAATTVAFLPVAFVLLVVLFLGLGVLYPWVATPAPKKALWLSERFVALRMIVGVGLWYWVSIRFAQAVHASPAGASEDPGRARRTRLAVVMLFLYVIVGSLVGFDLVMSLDPRWYSGLLGGYFVVGMIYSGFAFLVVLMGVRSLGRPGWALPATEVQDLAKLVFATSIVWMYFFWSQYLVIWYGNVPVETRFVLARFFEDPWRTLAVAAFLIGWLFPFGYFLARLTGRPPEDHHLLVGVSCLALLAVFIERIVLVLPSVAQFAGFRYGAGDVLLTVLLALAFGALFVLSYRVFVPRLGLASSVEG